MPPVRWGDPKPVAVLSSDWHLSDKPPLIRSAEPDWFAAMARPISQVRELCHKHDVPLLLAGDLFDKWNPSPALIAFAMRELPLSVYAVPGQHDLRHHRLDSLKDTAFGVLVEAGRIGYLGPGEGDTWCQDLSLHGFPWGNEVIPCPERHQFDTTLHVAVIHSYVWVRGRSYLGADKGSHLRSWADRLKDYDVAVFGDNHLHFCGSVLHAKNKEAVVPTVWNCGGLTRRKLDEINYEPSVGLLWSDGRVEQVLLDTSEDRFIRNVSLGRDSLRGEELEQLIADLKGASDDPLDFKDSLRRALEKLDCSQGVREMVLKSVGE